MDILRSIERYHRASAQPGMPTCALTLLQTRAVWSMLSRPTPGRPTSSAASTCRLVKALIEATLPNTRRRNSRPKPASKGGHIPGKKLGLHMCVNRRTTAPLHLYKNNAFTKGRGLTLTYDRVLVRTPVDEPGLPPTDTLDHTVFAIRALMPVSSA